MVHRSIMSCFAVAAMALGAGAGTIRTFDGRTLTGTVTLEADLKLSLTPKAGSISRHSMDDALWVNFQNAETTRTRRWLTQDIGSSTPAGSARIQGDAMSIRGGGAGLNQYHLAHQFIRGDGSIRAKVTAVGRSDAQASAGLTLRASTDPNAANISIAYLAGGGGVVSIKPAEGAASSRKFTGNPPGWLKLSRDGDAYVASSSEDGKTWTTVWSGSLAMPSQLLAGAFAHSHNKNMLSTASFESVLAETNDPASDQGFKGVILREGSKIACDIIGANDSATHVKRALDKDLLIPLAEISRISWRSASSRFGAAAPSDKTGVLLTGGDFFEGTLAGLTDSKARISSVLFGLKEFESSKIQALCLGSPRIAPTRFIVRLSDGSTLLTDKITSEKNSFAAEVSGVGLVHFTKDNLVEIRAGESRYQSLADFKPIKSDGVTDVAPGGVEPSLRGVSADHFIGIRAGGSVVYSVPADAKIFSARLGVPDGVLPTAALRFVIRLDDREDYRSAELTSLSDEVSVALPVSSARTIGVWVESPAGSFGGMAILADPAMVK